MTLISNHADKYDLIIDLKSLLSEILGSKYSTKSQIRFSF